MASRAAEAANQREFKRRKSASLREQGENNRLPGDTKPAEARRCNICRNHVTGVVVAYSPIPKRIIRRGMVIAKRAGNALYATRPRPAGRNLLAGRNMGLTAELLK